ncbi:MAG: putative transport system permease protein [Acidimicrobiaceae bacterium]|jgi:putative ABC transport system permease protein
MFRTTLKNLAARKLRLLTTSIAVLLGVAFMAGTLVLTDTVGKTFDNLFANVNAGTSAYVRGETAFGSDLGDQRDRLDASLVQTVSAVDGVQHAEGSIEAYAQLVDKNGKVIGDPKMGAPTFGGIWLTDDKLNPFDLAEGRAPQSTTEVVIDKGSASKGHFVLGDSVKVLTKSGTQTETIVGIATFGGEDSPAGVSYTLFTPDAAQTFLTEPGKIDAIKVVAADGVSDRDLADRIAKAVPAHTQVLTGAEITAENQKAVREGISFFSIFLMTFAVIALFVGSFIIYNSFSILVAQRSKEMALMRAIGASRRQVLGSVLFEAVVVGLIASLAGLAAGIGVATGLKELMNAVGFDTPDGAIVVTSSTVVISMIAGLGVSVASAVFPARKASKVPPIAAMRDVALDTSGSSRKRFVTGSVIGGLGAFTMGAGLFGGAGIGPVALGVPLVFVGVAVLGPVIARPVSWVLGSPLPRLKGMAGTLARENAMRNPKRTSATAAALMIGVALVSFITILASSTKASISQGVDKRFTGDFVIDSGTFGLGGLSPDLAEKLKALPELDAVSGSRMTPTQVNGAATLLSSGDPVAMQKITDFGITEGSFRDLGPTQIAVLKDTATSNGWKIGDTVPVRFAKTGEQQFTIAALFTESDVAEEFFISLTAFDANVADHFDSKVYVTLADGVSAEQGRAAITKVTDGYPQATVQDRTEYKDAQGSEIDMMLNLIYALLALAVFIALLGIANTLALSMFERTRELGLLRAVGMTRRQLRTTVRYESVIIALLGTTLGLAIGVSFGWAMVKALSGNGLSTFALPYSQLTVMAVIAVFAGIAAAILPARRASRLNVLEAIISE